jgi:hypothetical protein
MFLPQIERQNFAPIQHNWQNYNFVYLIFRFFDVRREDKLTYARNYPQCKFHRYNYFTFYFLKLFPVQKIDMNIVMLKIIVLNITRLKSHFQFQCFNEIQQHLYSECMCHWCSCLG